MENSFGSLRRPLTVVVTGGTVVYFSAMLWSTCAGISCGSLHSSIWPRISVLCLPFLTLMYAGWRARQRGHIGAGVPVSLPFLIVTTLLSAWSVANTPGSDPNDVSGGMPTEHTAAVISVIVIGVVLTVPLVVLIGLTGTESVRAVLKALVRRWELVIVAILTAAIAATSAWFLVFTSAAGLTGIDINPPAPGQKVSSDAYVVMSHCSDQRLVNCTTVSSNMKEGSSFDLAPGIYVVANNPPAGVTCNASPATFYLFPFERIQIQFLNVSCQSNTSAPPLNP